MKKFLLPSLALSLLLACSSSKSAKNPVETNSVSIVSDSAVTGSKELKQPRRGEVLFLGNLATHHDAGKYAPWLAISLFKVGINVTYTVDLNDLNTENLNKFDALVIYSNHDTISTAQEAALKGFVEGGKGLVPIHCAAGCFRNSDWYINTVGCTVLVGDKRLFYRRYYRQQ